MSWPRELASGYLLDLSQARARLRFGGIAIRYAGASVLVDLMRHVYVEFAIDAR